MAFFGLEAPRKLRQPCVSHKMGSPKCAANDHIRSQTLHRHRGMILGLFLAVAVFAQDDPCQNAHKTQASCDADHSTGGGCTWCKCQALPSACWTKTNAAKLPAGVYICDNSSVVEEAPAAPVDVTVWSMSGCPCSAQFAYDFNASIWSDPEMVCSPTRERR